MVEFEPGETGDMDTVPAASEALVTWHQCLADGCGAGLGEASDPRTCYAELGGVSPV